LRIFRNDFNIPLAGNKDRVAPYSIGDGCWHIRVASTDAAAIELALSTNGLPARRGGGMEARRRTARAFLLIGDRVLYKIKALE
jgi:hypothetical protein